MVTKIRDATERSLYVAQIDQIKEKLAYQALLAPECRVGGPVLRKLEALLRVLQVEVEYYDKLDKF